MTATDPTGGADGGAGSLPGVRESDDRLTIEAREGDPPTVALVGEVDPHTAPQLASALSGLVEAGASVVHVDCSRLDFIDSSGLRVLVEAHRQLGDSQQSLVLTAVSPTFRRLLEVTGLDEHITVEAG